MPIIYILNCDCQGVLAGCTRGPTMCSDIGLKEANDDLKKQLADALKLINVQRQKRPATNEVTPEAKRPAYLSPSPSCDRPTAKRTPTSSQSFGSTDSQNKGESSAASPSAPPPSVRPTTKGATPTKASF